MDFIPSSTDVSTGGAAGNAAASSPGKVSTTTRLTPRAQQVVFRVESAEAAAAFADRFGPRDGNGVAAGAATAVDHAATGAGSPLPHAARTRFEASLGADLSAVRVHTGAASADAAGALGARAYTVGDDIHFGAGQYAPDDPFGLHLLAHEVAHTRQQAAAAPAAQCKLAVSSPGDAAEVEADRAADAMVSGAPATIAARPGAIARQAIADLPPSKQVSLPVAVDDPYQRPPTDWTHFPPSGGKFSPVADTGSTSVDPAFTPTYEFAAPIGPTGNDGSSAPATDAQVLAAEQAKTAFSTALRILADSTRAAYPQVPDYRAAYQHVDELDVVGLADAGGKPDLAGLVAGQDTNGVTLGKVFESSTTSGTGTSAQVDLSKAKLTQDAKNKAKAVETAVANARADTKAYQAAVDATVGFAQAHANELAAAEIQAEEKAVDGLQGDLAGAQKEKAEIAEKIELAGKTISAAIKFAKMVVEPNVSDGIEFVLPMAEALLTKQQTADIDKKIANLTATIDGATARIKAHKVTLQSSKVEAARKLYDASLAAVHAAAEKLAASKLAVRDAYAAFSSAAAHAAGGSEDNQNRVEMAIRAIPAVELLVAKLVQISSAATLPACTEAGGRGFNASHDAAAFRVHYGNVRSLHEEFGGATATWRKRLASLEAVGGALGLAGGGVQSAVP